MEPFLSALELDPVRPPGLRLVASAPEAVEDPVGTVRSEGTRGSKWWMAIESAKGFGVTRSSVSSAIHRLPSSLHRISKRYTPKPLGCVDRPSSNTLYRRSYASQRLVQPAARRSYTNSSHGGVSEASPHDPGMLGYTLLWVGSV